MNTEKAIRFLTKIKKSKSKVLVLGDVMLDHYIHGHVNRISPEAPVPILTYANQNKSLGGAGNVVYNLINLGAEVVIATLVGADNNGRIIKNLFNDIKVSTENLFISDNVKTTVKTRFLSTGTQLLRVDNDSSGFLKSDYDLLFKNILSNVNTYNYIIISDYNKGACYSPGLEALIIKANKNKIPVYVDPKGENWKKYSNSFCITPNKIEAENEIQSKLVTDSDFENASKIISEKYKLDSCLITRGDNGMTFYNDKNIYHQKVGKKEVFDVSGAGDAVIACLAASINSGFSIKESLELSSIVSSEVVTHIGTVPFSLNMVKS